MPESPTRREIDRIPVPQVEIIPTEETPSIPDEILHDIDPDKPVPPIPGTPGWGPEDQSKLPPEKRN